MFLIWTVKGYLRKGSILLAMKEPTKASSAYQKALEIDPNSEVSMKQSSWHFVFKQTNLFK